MKKRSADVYIRYWTMKINHVLRKSECLEYWWRRIMYGEK